MGRKLMGRRGCSMEGGLLVILKDRLRVGRELGGGSGVVLTHATRKYAFTS
jgi:hypothetical protein